LQEGQLGSLNPNPLLGGNDGFVLGYDDALLKPTDDSRYVARLGGLATARGRRLDARQPA
jgi:hypothetical protein